MSSAIQTKPNRKHNSSEWRDVFPLPLADKFYNIVQDRLHMIVENTLFQGDTRFTLLINAINREEHKRYSPMESPDFIYAGLQMQRVLLDREARKRWNRIPKKSEKIKEAWDYLGRTTIMQSNSEVSTNYYKGILTGDLRLSDACAINTLKSYFHKETDKYTQEMKMEKRILEDYFNLDEDMFISVPLFGFAEFDGVVHIIFKKDMLGLIDSTVHGNLRIPERLMWTLLRSFIAIYDGLFLHWDLEGENLEKISAINEFVTSTILAGDNYFKKATGTRKTKIIRELQLQEYYRQHRDYFKIRLESGKDVPGKIYQQYITHAVSSILVDSYAHNISAHALSTLAWWYYRRGKMLRDEEVDWDALLASLRLDKDIDQKMLEGITLAIEERRKVRKNRNKQNAVEIPKEGIRVEDGEKVIRYPGSLARELTQLLRFLTEKGAYWSGVARDANVGGKVSSLYSVLWYDFINNPFFVGTIAKTEDILKIHIRIILYNHPVGEEQISNKTLYHDKIFLNENDGIFATVDLSDPRTGFTGDLAKSHDDTLSAFVKKGEKFEHFREKLKAIKVFFPGGIVGRHAFYTMIENEIRNVKHYNRDELHLLQKEGLTVAIGIQDCSLHNSNNKEIYRVSIWLDTPTRLGKEENHLLYRKWNMLKGDIINSETRAPQLGGSYQDKVCASFLMNGSFSHVQRGDRNPDRDKREDTERDKNYFPWVRPVCSTIEPEIPNGHRDYKISYNNPMKTVKVSDPADPYGAEKIDFQPIVYPNLPSIGYSKKVFYVWRGENLMDWDARKFGKDGDIASWDNPSRFIIVNMKTADDKTFEYLRRERGVVRIVDGVEIIPGKEDDRFTIACTKWLRTLLEKNISVVELAEDSIPLYQFVLDAREEAPLFYYHSLKTAAPPPYNEQIVNSILTQDNLLKIIHKSDNIVARGSEIRYRNHGIYRTYFFPNNFKALSETQRTHRMLDLFEVLTTRICIFDNRVQHRLRIDEQEQGMERKNDPYRTMLRDNLKLGIYNESIDTKAIGTDTVPAWLSTLDTPDIEFVKNCHFLVMHLSFIESILSRDKEGHGTKDGNVGYFIDKYIAPFVGQRDNFFLVITTGRGRNEWWGTIGQNEYKEKGYTKFVLFRPIESLLAGVENAVNMQDDIELKYRITKVLYGS